MTLSRLRIEMSGFRMITQFPLDPMHLIDLGVVKTMLNLIRSRRTPIVLRKSDIETMNEMFVSFKTLTPSEFARKPRSLTETPYFKATEFRQIVLYSGIVLFKHCLSPEQYKHFLLLSCAYRILSSQVHLQNLNNCDRLLKLFVEQFKTFYGKLG